MKIVIIIPVHNRLEFTVRCMQSLRAQTYREFHTIIIDDGSSDGTYELLKNRFPEVRIIRGDGSWWWTRSINVGIKEGMKLNPEFILTLNNDTLPGSDYLEKLISATLKFPGAIIGSAGVSDSGTIIYAGVNIHWLTAKIEKVSLQQSPENLQYIQINQFSGRGLLIPLSVFENIGFFDEKKFPHYGADIDFTTRATLNKIKIICALNARLIIYPAESSDQHLRAKKSLSNYYMHLFSRKGGGNIRRFVRFSLKNCPKRYLLPNLFFGIIRRLFGFWF